MTVVETLLDWLGKNHYYIGNDLLEKVEELKEVEKQKEQNNFIGGYLTHAMRKNKLPYGMEYLGKVADLEVKAEKLYKNKAFKKFTKCLACEFIACENHEKCLKNKQQTF